MEGPQYSAILRKNMAYVLVLNASFEFLNVASLERAIKLLYKGKAEVVESNDAKEVGSTTFRIKMPSIIRMLYYIIRPHKVVPLTKKNILLRDNHTCQYCGSEGDTVDHVIPKSRGGRDTWENCVCACGYCNTRKNNRTPDEAQMALERAPKRPAYIPWVLVKRDASKVGWAKYLYWNISIENTSDHPAAK